jgi:hypothetical protein
MNNHRLFTLLIVAGLSVLVTASAAEALVINYFPIFGIVNGVQTARINAVLNAPPDNDLLAPCRSPSSTARAVRSATPTFSSFEAERRWVWTSSETRMHASASGCRSAPL